MTRKKCSIILCAALGAALLAVGCSQVLGFKDPRLEDTSTTQDAATDGAPRDTAIIDGPMRDGPDIDARIIDGPTGPTCRPADCPFGCDTTTDACRPGKLFVYLTAGAFLGNGFGGSAGAAAVRSGADARCLQTYADQFSALQCNPSRVHAVLSVNTADDSIEVMSSKFSIPTTVEVHRADDDVLVFNNWNDLTDNTRAPRAPVSTAPDQDADLVWSGFKSTSNCKGWTSGSAADPGVIGHTSLTFASWLQRASQTCEKFGRLLCVCWTGD
jgi:hypothetical protein